MYNNIYWKKNKLIQNEIYPLLRVSYIKCTLCYLVRVRANDRVRKEICGYLSGVQQNVNKTLVALSRDKVLFLLYPLKVCSLTLQKNYLIFAPILQKPDFVKYV